MGPWLWRAGPEGSRGAATTINGGDAIGGQRREGGAADEACRHGRNEQACAVTLALPGRVTGETGRSCRGAGGGGALAGGHGGTCSTGQRRGVPSGGAGRGTNRAGRPRAHWARGV